MRTLRVGLVGAGYIAPYHVQALARVPQATLVGITDLDAERARRVAEEHGIAATFPTLAALVAAGVDVVHVLTPPSAHAAVALEAIELGCDVLVEKPLATSVEDCDRIAAAAERAGRRVAVSHSLLADPQVRRALAAVRAGRIGDVVSAEYFCSSVYPEWAGGPLPPQYRDGGYPFRDLGVHGLYLLRECLGEIDGVDAQFRTRGGDPNLCFDEWQALVRCAGGSGRIYLTWNVEPLQTVLTIHGTRGTLRADVGLMFLASRRATRLPKIAERAVNAVQDSLPGLWAVPANAARVLTGRLRSYQGLRDFVRAFYAALAADAPLPASVEAGRSVVHWVEAAARPADVAKDERARRHAPSGAPAVVVTGAAGFLGRALVTRLVADGERVRVLVRRPPATPDPRVEVVLGDLGDERAVAGALAGATCVYHVGAAMQGGWAEHQRGTIGGTRHVIAGCLAADVPRLVYVSSLSVLHGAGLNGHAPVTETAPLEPRAAERGFYTQAKLAAEGLVRDAVRDRGLRAVIVRPGQIIGPGTPVAAVCGALGFGSRLVVLGDGTMVLPLVHVADVVEALVLAGRTGPTDGSILHVVDDAGVTQRELTEELARAHGLRAVHVPPWVVQLLAGAVEALGRALKRRVPLTRYRLASAQADLRFDCSKARTTLDWTPHVGVRQGIEELAARA